MPDSARTILVAGASRGLGLGLAREYLRRGWRVIGTVRDPDRPTGLHELQPGSDGRLEVERLDVTLPAEIAALRGRLKGRTLDILLVNAGIANDPMQPIGEVATATFTEVMQTNVLGPMRVLEALTGRVARDGTVAAMSSGLGSVGRNEDGGWELYRASKAALNTLLRSFAARRGNGERAFIAVAPGWVRTDMGGRNAALDVETSTRGIADTLAARHGIPGAAFLDYRGRTLPW